MAIIADVRTIAVKDGRTVSAMKVCLHRSRRCVRTTRRSGRRSASDRKCAAQVVVAVQEPDLSLTVQEPDLSREELDARAARAAAGLLRRIGQAWPERSPSEVSALFCVRQAALCSPPLAAWLFADGLEERRCTALPADNPEVQHAPFSEFSTPPRPEPRRVAFDLDRTEVHEVTPYNELYGLHPREFVFGRHGDVVPSGDTYGFIDFLAACRASQVAADVCTDLIAEDEDGSCGESDEEDEVEWW